MKKLYVTQKVLSLGGHFVVTDEEQTPVYEVKGSLFKLAKSFTIVNQANQEVAKVTRKPFHLYQTYEVEMAGKVVATIRKKLSLFRSKFEIDAGRLEVVGDILNLNFSITKAGKEVASIKESAMSFGHAYQLTIDDDQYTDLTVAILLAIDYVKAQESSRQTISPSN